MDGVEEVSRPVKVLERFHRRNEIRDFKILNKWAFPKRTNKRMGFPKRDHGEATEENFNGLT